MMAPSDRAFMTMPTRLRATAGRQETAPATPARLHFARGGRGREPSGTGRGRAAARRSTVRRATGGTQSARLDDLALHRKTSPFAKPAQALHNRLVPNLFGRAAVFADHELT